MILYDLAELVSKFVDLLVVVALVISVIRAHVRYRRVHFLLNAVSQVNESVLKHVVRFFKSAERARFCQLEEELVEESDSRTKLTGCDCSQKGCARQGGSDAARRTFQPSLRSSERFVES